MKFEWDENQSNIRKHGVDFHQAVYVFADPFALSIPDDEHSENEERWLLLGKSLNEQILLVVHPFRYDNVIRIISARKATQNEKSTYTQRAKP
ncbi:MAG: BrnT family toxin [Syntrophaceae bacterium]|nr:BrnT family toxin [Syntrophaceae bacterium]